MSTNPSTPKPKHDQSLNPIFPDRSCETCAHCYTVSYPTPRGHWHDIPYCTQLNAAIKTTSVGCSYWEARPTNDD